MVTCVDRKEKYRSVLSNGNVSIECDNPKAYGGAGHEFGPHDFIEAGYAACLKPEQEKSASVRTFLTKKSRLQLH